MFAPGAPAEGTLHLFWAEMGTVGIGGRFWRQFTPSLSSRALAILEETAGRHPSVSCTGRAAAAGTLLNPAHLSRTASPHQPTPLYVHLNPVPSTDRTPVKGPSSRQQGEKHRRTRAGLSVLGRARAVRGGEKGYSSASPRQRSGA